MFLDEHEQSINAGVFFTTQPAWVRGGSPQDSGRGGPCPRTGTSRAATSRSWTATSSIALEGAQLYKGVDFPASPGADLQDLIGSRTWPHDPL